MSHPKRQRASDRTFFLYCEPTDQSFYKVLAGEYLEAAKLDGSVDVYCEFCGREHELEVIRP